LPKKIRIPPNLFSDIVGYDDVKSLLLKTIRSYGDGLPVHFLLVGEPATAKSLFLLSLERIKGAEYRLGSRLSRSGLVELLIGKKPHLVLIDEIDKVSDRECLAVLLSLMETGRIVETLHGKMRTEKLEVIVVAAANDISELPRELLSRFIILRFKPYKWGEFLKIARNILVKREGVKPRIAKYIASVVWNKLGSKDFRDCIKLARLIRDGQNKREIDLVVRTLAKYS